MRFATLELRAYGPFTDVTLDFRARSPGLHVIHGANEAGKSSALRAITALLYGMSPQTRDAHLHDYATLRVAARMVRASGEELFVVRRKGARGQSLLDEQDAPVDEALLRAALGDVGQDLFRSLFGLDHATLVAGGDALLRGRGSLGESLFAAGLGMSRLHAVRTALEVEASALYRSGARATNPPLNVALKAYNDAKARVTAAATPTRVWMERDAERARAEERRRAVVQELAVLRVEERRLERARRAAPHLATRRALAQRCEQLGEVVLVAEDAAERRREAQRVLADAARRRGEVVTERDRRGRERAARVVPEALLAARSTILELQRRLGSHEKAARDRVRRQAEIERLDEEVRATLWRIGAAGGPGVESLVPARVDASLERRVRRLAAERAKLDERAAGFIARREDATARRSRLAARLCALPPAVDASPLRRAVDAATRAGDLDGQLSELDRTLSDLGARAKRALAALGLWRGPLEEVLAIALPPLETVDRFAEERSALAREEERVAAATESETLRRDGAQRKLDELRRGDDVPTLADLDAARAARDLVWTRIRAAWLFGTADEAPFAAKAPEHLAETYEADVAAADAVADRLRREADRVAAIASSEAELDDVARRLAELRIASEAVAARRAAHEATWRSAWTHAGIDPLPPREMRAWLERHARLGALVESLLASRREREATLATVAAHRERLTDCTAAGERGRDGGSLTGRLDEARARLARIDDVERSRVELCSRMADVDAEIARVDADERAHAAGVAAWRADWVDAAVAAGAAPEAHPEDVAAGLEERRVLAQKLDEATALRARVAAIDRDADDLARDLAAVVALHAPDLASAPVEAQGAGLQQRFEQAGRDLAAREQIDVSLAGLDAELETLDAQVERARGVLAELCAAGHVDDPSALESIERRSAEARALARELAAVESTLGALAEGATLDELAAGAAAYSETEVASRLAGIRQQIEGLEHERTGLEQRTAVMGHELDGICGESAATAAAAEAHEALATLRALAERYLAHRIAAIVLAREIERYRKQHEGPVLRRASELLGRLTQRAFERITTAMGDDGEPVLRCVRRGGAELDVTALSEGTRDQLYLALRLATLEGHIAHAAEPLPLIVDDLFVHFDDARSRAGLEVLADLASRTQVLFFTHHERLVEQAREVVPDSRLALHQLAPSAPPYAIALVDGRHGRQLMPVPAAPAPTAAVTS